ncbi:hypothetical protein BTH42_23290 [Burkholderia sp. SRS-W-2-2016]|nr:hypothetical protein BTH42_23290 [Burkholderia sp. SRS-W-2-2016]
MGLVVRRSANVVSIVTVYKRQGMGRWLAIGIAVGVAVGAATASMGLWLSLGAAIGGAIGAGSKKRHR